MRTVQLVIVGQGPAGLSAALYTCRAGIETVIVGLTPKIDGDYDIDNYFGFAETVTGAELMDRGRRGVARFGAEFVNERVLGIHFADDGCYEVKTETMHIKACAVLLATGVSHSKPAIPGLDAMEGKGVSYCVSCDGFFYRGKQVLVLGEGVYAASQALELTSYTPRVAICTHGKKPAITPEFLDKLAAANIPVLEGKIERLEGAGGLERVVFTDGGTFETFGLFVAMGEASSSDFAWTLGLEREGNAIKADLAQKTNIPGVFAAGDCVGRFKQISVAVGEGALAGRSIISYVRENCPKTPAKTA